MTRSQLAIIVRCWEKVKKKKMYGKGERGQNTCPTQAIQSKNTRHIGEIQRKFTSTSTTKIYTFKYELGFYENQYYPLH